MFGEVKVFRFTAQLNYDHRLVPGAVAIAEDALAHKVAFPNVAVAHGLQLPIVGDQTPCMDLRNVDFLNGGFGAHDGC